MADYVCVMQGDEPHGQVVELQTSLTTGTTLALCDACLPVALVGRLAAWLGIDADSLYEAVRKHADREGKKAAAAAAKALEDDGQAEPGAESPAPEPEGAQA